MTTVLTSLPYIDNEYSGKLKQKVDSLIEEEMRMNPMPLPDISEKFPAPKSLLTSPLLLAEMERHKANEPMPKIKFPSTSVPNDPTDPAAWQKSIGHAYSQLQAHEAWGMNIELSQRFSSQAWLEYNKRLEKTTIAAEDAQINLDGEVENINRKRKSDQLAAGQVLSTLNDEFVETIRRNYSVAKANAALESEVQALKRQCKREDDSKMVPEQE